MWVLALLKPDEGIQHMSVAIPGPAHGLTHTLTRQSCSHSTVCWSLETLHQASLELGTCLGEDGTLPSTEPRRQGPHVVAGVCIGVVLWVLSD